MPVCSGWQTTSGRPNLLNHIKGLAKTELLNNYLDIKIPTPHADFLKKNCRMIAREQKIFIVKFGKTESVLTIK